MSKNKTSQENTVEAEVLETSVIDESIFLKVLFKAGRIIAKPALEAMEILINSTTPTRIRLTMLAALTYLIMPLDFVPDFIPVGGFSDDLVALTAVLTLCKTYVTPEINQTVQRKLNNWFPL